MAPLSAVLPWQRTGMWMRMPDQGFPASRPGTPGEPLAGPRPWGTSQLMAGAILGAGAAFRMDRAGGTRAIVGAATSSSVEVDEETQLRLQRELADWGDDEELEEADGKTGPDPSLVELEDTDWRKWAPRVSKKRVWSVLREGGKVSSDEWKEVMLALRRGDALSSKEEYEDALSFLAKTKGGWRDAEVILQCMWFNGFFPDHRHYALVMQGLFRSSRYDKIVKLFEEMAEHDIAPCGACYELAIQAYDRKDETEGAWQLLKAIEADGHTPSLKSFHGVLHALAKEGACMKSLAILEDMLEHSVEPSRRTFDLLILAYGNGGDFAGVLRTMDYMQKMGLEPRAQTFLYGMRAAERVGEIDLGLELFRRMKARGIKTNERIDEALMKISLAGNDPDRALQFFDAAVQRRHNWGQSNADQPTGRELIIYRQALRACEMGAATGLPPGPGITSYQDYALQLLLDLQEAELPVDGTMYLHAVTCCEYKRSWIRVIALLREMKEKGIKVEGERLRSAFWNGIQAADEADNVDEAYELFEQMKEYKKLTVEPHMYISMVQMLEKHGVLARAHSVDCEFQELQMKEFSKELMTHRKRNEWQEAIGVLDKICEQNLTPTLKVFNTAISALQRPGKWELVLEMMADMKRQGYVLDACSHTVAISAMITAGEIQRAVKQLKVMKQEAVHPTSLTYGRLIYALEEAGEPEQALYLWDELRTKHITPDRVSYESAIRACRSCELWEAILELYGEMKEKDKGPSKASRESAALAAERLGLAQSVMDGAARLGGSQKLDVEAEPEASPLEQVDLAA